MGGLDKVLWALVIAASGCSDSVREGSMQRTHESSFRVGYLSTRLRDTEGRCHDHKYTIRDGVLSFGGPETYSMPDNGGIEMMFMQEQPDKVRLKGVGADGSIVWENVYEKSIDVAGVKNK